MLILKDNLFIEGDLFIPGNGKFPLEGFVKTESALIVFAEKERTRIFGQKVLNNKPYIAKLEYGILKDHLKKRY